MEDVEMILYAPENYESVKPFQKSIVLKKMLYTESGL